MIPDIDYVIIENVYPEIDGGYHFVKKVIGDIFRVEADIFTHGHDIIRANLLYRKKGQTKWKESPMKFIENDRWFGDFILEENTFYEYTIFGWRDSFLTWEHDTYKKYIDDQDIYSDLLEGKILIENAIKKTKKNDTKKFEKLTDIINQILKLEKVIKSKIASNSNFKLFEKTIFGDDIIELMKHYPDTSSCGQYNKILTVFANRKEAFFASWYEMWHRSQGKIENKSATFQDMETRLPEIKELGFNVLYLPPIHPVGTTNRKGPNNSLKCPEGCPGSIYAIGSKDGGHTAIEPLLGTIENFIAFEKSCKKYGMEIALDIALQVSPDHPWVKEHPNWFKHRPDGSIKYAENPPKKYEDIYPINFETDDKEALWNEILAIFKFWINKDVKIFRVDNPHTKPVYFWKWLISEIHKTNPEVIFLSEAFTKPKMMKILAKIGFTQSYTYFTWRNFKQEIIDYFNELTASPVADFMIGNLFTNTPDILPFFLQNAHPAAFKIRATLAATLSSVWGIYNGFELCEGSPMPGKEEYINSEKYQFKVWDWDRPGNIKYYIKKLNYIRNNFSPLQEYTNLLFYRADNDNILFYGKHTRNYKNIILVIINLDPYHTHDSFIYIPIDKLKISHDETYMVHDLLTNDKFYWQGEKNFVRLNPNKEPAHIFRIIRNIHKEQEFDYF